MFRKIIVKKWLFLFSLFNFVIISTTSVVACNLQYNIATVKFMFSYKANLFCTKFLNICHILEYFFGKYFYIVAILFIQIIIIWFVVCMFFLEFYYY